MTSRRHAKQLPPAVATDFNRDCIGCDEASGPFDFCDTCLRHAMQLLSAAQRGHAKRKPRHTRFLRTWVEAQGYELAIMLERLDRECDRDRTTCETCQSAFDVTNSVASKRANVLAEWLERPDKYYVCLHPNLKSLNG